MATDKTQKISVEVPAGMTAEKLLGLLEQFEKRRTANVAYREGRNKAITALVANHKEEYEGLLSRFKK